MINTKDMVECFRAVELLHYGVDITQLETLKQYWNIKEKKLQSKLSGNVGDFFCKIDDDVAEFIEWSLGKYFSRRGLEFSAEFEPPSTTLNCSVDLDTFKKIMTILKMKGWCKFEDIEPSLYDKDYEERMAEMRRTWNYHDTSDCPMIQELSHDAVKDNLHCLLTLCEYGEDTTKKILENYDNSPKSFEIDALKDYEVIDNRIYIKIPEFDKIETRADVDDIKYLVISHNVYDYFFCSYGSEIQSCYSLTSSHYGWYGMVALSACKGNFIVYFTTGKPNRINIINGTKWSVPRMFMRCWGWLGEDGKLYLDRSYIGASISHYETALRKLIFKYTDNKDGENLPQPLKYRQDMVKWHESHRLRMYPDSIKVRDFYFYGVCNGDRSFVGNGEPFSTTFFNKTQEITLVPKGFEYCMKYSIIDGVLTKTRLCPITGLALKPDEVKSKYAKYFKDPVKNLAVLSYCDGHFKADALNFCNRYNGDYLNIDPSYTGCNSKKEGSVYKFYKYWSGVYGNIPIKVFKEAITGLARNSDFDTILVRYIEDDKVTFVKYKGKKS